MSKIFAIILSVLLLLPVTVWAVDETDVMPEQPAVTNQIDEDIDTQSIEYKQPLNKRKIAKKFLAAMGGVAVSSFAIFFLLSVYNRVRENLLNQVKTPDGETSLATPDDLESAIKTFLSKTKW